MIKKMTAKRLVRIIMLLVISIFAGGSIYAWNAETLVGNSMPMPFGVGMSVVMSGSMEPELSVNDLVIVRSQESYEKGDIVVYQDGSSLVIHRIIGFKEDKVITKGDANEVPDKPVLKRDIKGRYKFRIPILGVILLFLKSPAGFILMLILAVLLFEYPYLKERKESLQKQEELKEQIRQLKSEVEKEHLPEDDSEN